MAFTLLINAVDRSTYVKFRPEPTWRLPIRGQRGDSTFTLQVTNGDGFTPAARQRVVWKDNGTTVWTGTIDRVQVTHEAPLATVKFYAITAVSEEQRLDKLFVTRTFAAGTTCGAIVTSILATEAASEGLSSGTISTGATLDEAAVYEQARISDVFTDLQRRSADFVWYIVNQTVYFEARSTTAAPYSVTDATPATANVLNSPQPMRRYDRSNYRNRQHLKITERYLPPYRMAFAGDGTTFSFTADQAVREIISVTLTTATQSSSTGTFTGVPSNGDTAVIGDVTYTFRSSAAASAFNRTYSVLIGVSATATATNLVNAINDTGTGRGSTYGWPCKQHPQVYATSSSGTVTLKSTYVGSWTSGSIALSESTANFTWAASHLTGGADGVDTPQTYASDVGQANNAQWSYTVGGTTVQQTFGQSPPSSGTLVFVVYRPVGYGTITLEDSAEVATVATAESGSGIYENKMQRSDLRTYDEAVTFGGKILDALMTLNETVTWTTDTYGLFPGQVATLSISRLGISGSYLIQSIEGRFVGTQSNRLHFRYGVTAQSATHATTFLDFWVPLADLGPLQNPTTNITTGNNTGTNSPPSGGTPTWNNDSRGQIASFGFANDTVGENTSSKYVPVHRSGTPYKGYLTWVGGAPLSSPYVPAPSKYDVLRSTDGGLTWTTIFAPSTLSGTNLTVDSVTNTDVTPDGYTPVSSDVGRIIRVKSGTGWTTGYYKITALASGKWRLNSSPAAVSIASGVWGEAIGFTVYSDILATYVISLYAFDNLTFSPGDILRGDTLLAGGMTDTLLTVEWQPQGNSGSGASLQLGGSGAGQSFFLTSMA